MKKEQQTYSVNFEKKFPPLENLNAAIKAQRKIILRERHYLKKTEGENEVKAQEKRVLKELEYLEKLKKERKINLIK